jgi:hypothetical protein
MKKVLFGLAFLLSSVISYAGQQNSLFWYSADDVLNYVDDKRQDCLKVIISSSGPAIPVTASINVASATYTSSAVSLSTPAVQYVNQTVFVSSGDAGIITGVTSFTITIADKVKEYYFGMLNTNDATIQGAVSQSLFGKTHYFNCFNVVDHIVDYPQAITFIGTIPVSSTVTYDIRDIK